MASSPHRSIDNLRRVLAVHPAFARAARSETALRTFTEHHVFAVWDFMTLLKSLQRDLTCVRLPWCPPRDAEAARLINEIVLGEESDRLADGRVVSHFELYRDAMVELGADTTAIDAFVTALGDGVDVRAALDASGAPRGAIRFVRHTLELVESGSLVARAAAFVHGRESLIPSMFPTLIEVLGAGGVPCRTLLTYLERHVELDGDEHGDLAERLLASLVGADDDARDAAARAAHATLLARLDLWDAVAMHVEAATAAAPDTQHDPVST